MMSFCTTAEAQNKNMSLFGSLSYTQDLNDVWGYTDSLGNEYALVGARNGVSIVDVTGTPIEVKFFSGPSSTWRDLKTWKGFAYVTNETSGGLLIIDLRSLPDTSKVTARRWSGPNGNLNSAHNLYIDENGICYVFGANIGNRGCQMYDVDSNQWTPSFVGAYDASYIHDGMARGDTLYAAHINSGEFTITDVSNKRNPSVLGSATTSLIFTHNIWVSDDGKYVYTTDEKSGAFIDAYDISDPSNIIFLDKEQSNPGSGVIPHNTHVLGNYLVTSYYNDGLIVHDATRSHNVVQVANYDTDPSRSGDGFTGSWGAFPYLPSGKLLASDIRRGLFVVEANFTRACYLEGNITDSVSKGAIPGADVELVQKSITHSSDLSGDYALGTVDTGTYTVTVTKPGYITKQFNNIKLHRGIVTQVDVELVPIVPFGLNVEVVDNLSGLGLPSATVVFRGNGSTVQILTDASGKASISNFLGGLYDVSISRWGHASKCLTGVSITSTLAPIRLDSGYTDDFSADLGWVVSGTAAAGMWERGSPNGTSSSGAPVNPGNDVNTDCLDQAYVTGNQGQGPSDDDVDNGNTLLLSPIMDISRYREPHLDYSRWFVNLNVNGGANDSMTVFLMDGANRIVLETITANSTGNGTWIHNSLPLKGLLSNLQNVRFGCETADRTGSGDWVEGGLDAFSLVDSFIANPGIEEELVSLQLFVAPNPSHGEANINFNLKNLPLNASLSLIDLTGSVIHVYPINSGKGSFRLGYNLAKGVYMLRLESSGKFTTRKFVRL